MLAAENLHWKAVEQTSTGDAEEEEEFPTVQASRCGDSKWRSSSHKKASIILRPKAPQNVLYVVDFIRRLKGL